MDTILGQYITTRSSILQAITLRLPNEKKKNITEHFGTNNQLHRKRKTENTKRSHLQTNHIYIHKHFIFQSL